MKKLKVGLLYGGDSEEHDVSVRSFQYMEPFFDRQLMTIVPIFVERSGANDQTLAQLLGVDVAFPLFHGPNGEDGTVQGLLEFLRIPYVGSGVVGSAVSMDKAMGKRICQAVGIPIAPYLVYRKRAAIDLKEVEARLGRKVIVKPVSGGSSIGISLVESAKELKEAIHEAFLYDEKIVIEKHIDCREFEVAVLAGVASLPGELIPKSAFYSFTDKCLDDHGQQFVLPAELSKELLTKLQEMSIEAATALETLPLCRVDFLMDRKSHQIYLNEVNAIPGMTKTSLYPKLWEISGVNHTEMLTRLVMEEVEKLSVHRTTMPSMQSS